MIGISTLAFTSDDLLVLAQQSENNSASGGLIAPSGSGSLEPDDLASAGDHPSLQQVLIRGMERELCEETGISSNDVLETRIIGFGRWLERGAKPEFFGITRLRILARDLDSLRISPEERIYTERLDQGARSDAVFVDFDQLRQDLNAGYSVDQAPSCPDKIRDCGSLPLIVGLRAVALYNGLRMVKKSQVVNAEISAPRNSQGLGSSI